MTDNSDLLDGVTQPTAETPLSEFIPPPARRELRTYVVLPPDPTKMEQKALKQYTQQKIRQAFHQLAMGNLDAVQSWLHDVAKDSPAKAIELFIEMAKFSLPQLKATEMTVTTENKTRTFTSSADILAELNGEAS